MLSSSPCIESSAKEHEQRYAGIFPLPLVPFELFLVQDDRPDYPMVFRVDLAFRGELNRIALEQAVSQAVSRNPILRSNLNWSSRPPTWVLAHEGEPHVEWLTEGETDRATQIRYIDLRKETGLRVFAQANPSDSKVWLHLHHACCDGQGARRFIVDLLTGYARACAVDSLLPQWDPLDYEALRTRAQFTSSEALEKAGAQISAWQKLREAYHFHWLTPRPIAPSLAPDRSPTPPPIYQHVFTSHETTQFKQRATQLRTTLNDVAVSLLFQSLAHWNVKLGRSGKDRLRLLMPTDLRNRGDERLPATNRMSFSFLSRTIAQCYDWGSLLSGVCEETRYFKQIQIGRDFLVGLNLARRVPGLLPLMLRLPRCMATATLTNLGDPTRRFRRRFPNQDGAPVIGNVVLDHICGTPPIRPLTYAGFGICLCSQKMSVSVAGDRRCLGEATSDLLQSYVDRWKKWGGI